MLRKRSSAHTMGLTIVNASVKLCLALVALAAISPATPTYAEAPLDRFVSANGSGSSCTAAAPCAYVYQGLQLGSPGRVLCLDGAQTFETEVDIPVNGFTYEIDCPLGAAGNLDFQALTQSSVSNVRIRHLTFTSANFGFEFQVGGTLVLEDCLFTDAPNGGLIVTPNAPLNLVIRNSRMVNNGAAITLKPAAGGSIKATLDHVTINGNTGGGIKVDTTNGVVNLDISDSEISNNGGNGINLVGSTNQNMLNLTRTVIAKNGAVGLQTNGTTAAALVDTTLFDTNASGATAVVNGGHILTYGNNRIVGSAGSGFTGPASLQ
jgi:hypothetical protein